MSCLKFDAPRSALSLPNEIALVTGGGSGLGYAMSAALLAAGARSSLPGAGKRFSMRPWPRSGQGHVPSGKTSPIMPKLNH